MIIHFVLCENLKIFSKSGNQYNIFFSNFQNFLCVYIATSYKTYAENRKIISVYMHISMNENIPYEKNILTVFEPGISYAIIRYLTN